ncbi:DUF599 domain-containing protein [Roseibium limicola]|uniref:DUF599 family protein n=1 Tax=Roseibium limicola TaxID=2816037 RepID=A0A939ENS0_9HYPH|nr:DUF599 family protein [Roseibium limicola]MBO0344763.1 DUF599 family protein [Roseibium limicola]
MTSLSLLDCIAISWFIVVWFGFNYLIDSSPMRKKSLSKAMEVYRRTWFLTLSRRSVRIMDTAILSGLQQGTAFFASTSLLAIGGSFALLDSTDTILQVAGDLSIPVEQSRALWEVKVLGLMLILAYSFFKFGWAYRLFNYCSIIMGAIPDVGTASDDVITKIANQAGDMNIIAGKHFNRGQRALFFAIAFLGWFAGPQFFMVTTGLVMLVLVRRQFASRSRDAVLSGHQVLASLETSDGAKTETGSSNPFT